MNRIQLVVPEEVKVNTSSALGSALERLVDADIADFDDFFRGLGNDPISRPEKAIIKTFLAWKLGLMKKQ